MCLFTHFAAGALAGGMTGNVWIAAAAGAASHAALDAIPHYDHPDWRVELVGGVFSLLLLLIMPFATWPAIVGGLFGMVPDLENLFQKLGKMRRDQFIFPSHTGLIPHGRNLGPRSLVWQLAIFVGCFAMLGLLNPAAASAAGTPASPVLGEPVVRVLQAGTNVTRVEVQCPVTSQPLDWDAVRFDDIRWSRPLEYLKDDAGRESIEAPRLDLPLAVPTRGSVEAHLISVEWWKEPARPVRGDQLISLGDPAVFRHVPLTGVTLPLGYDEGVLRRAVIEIRHAPAERMARQLQMASRYDPDKGDEDRELAPAGLLNPDLFDQLHSGGKVLSRDEKAASRGEFNPFDLTGNWLRLEIDSTGLHRLTGQELSSLGVGTGSVDPDKVRLYRGGARALDQDPEVPEVDQADRVGLTEVAIQMLDGDDGEWNLDDEIRFYAFESDFWLDRTNPSARPLEHYNHPYQDKAVYWLTWESVATPSPIPEAPIRVAEISAPAVDGDEVAVAWLRRHFEDQTYQAYGVVTDNWVWETTIYATETNNFSLQEVVPDSQGTFVIDFRGYPTDYSGISYDFMANAWVNEDSGNMVSTVFDGGDQVDSTRVRLVGETSELANGTNRIFLQASNPDRDYPLMLDSFDIMYWANLDLAGHGGHLEFSHWRYQVSEPGQQVDMQITVPGGSEVALWDVSDPAAAFVLQPEIESNLMTCGLTRQSDMDRHFVAATVGEMHRVAGGALVTPLDLRSAPVDADYIVIHPEAFAGPAQRLADFRDTSLPGESAPVAIAVTLDDIYASFAGGQKDPMAIRNYLKHVFEAGGGNLRFVCLLGNTTLDYRNLRGQDPSVDLVDITPGLHHEFFPQNPGSGYYYNPFGTDDMLVSFDTPPSARDMDFPDVAIGRLPAVTLAEANGLVDRSIAYADETQAGLWRNHMLFVADDGTKPSSIHWPEPNSLDHAHTSQAENLSGNFLPMSVDVQKIYGVAYDFPPGSGVKPEVRTDINAALNEGTTMYYYVGHGSENNLADEQIFMSQDIANLTNGMKRFAFIAFSCDVGVYDSPSRRSMAELFVSAENGGAIASICASQVSFINANEDLSDAFFSNLFPDRHVTGQSTLSEALLMAKSVMSDDFRRRNSQRYNLLSDPALILPHAVDDLEFASTSVDTLRAGARQVAVLNEDRKVMLAAGDAYSLRVEESAFDHGYIYVYVDSTDSQGDRFRVPRWDTFVEGGSTVFDGSGTMTGNELRVPFKVPAQLKYGDRARVRLMVETPDGIHAANRQLPSVRQATGPVDDLLGPGIRLAFEDDRRRVKAGTQLTATLNDTSSIAILGTTPGNSILLEFDNSGFMTDVTRSFTFDPDSYVAGRLSFPLPADLPLGDHRAALHASDVLGNVGSDTLSFSIVSEDVVGVESVTLFPNPTPGPCRLVFELSDPMLVKWDIYTLSGRRIRTVEDSLPGGPQILEWDGRDDQGDEIANGTYLFVLRGSLTGGGERDFTETGKLVIMR